MKIVYSEKFLEHENAWGSKGKEIKERLLVIKEFLDEKIKPKYFAPEPVSEKDLLCVHSQSLIDLEKKLCSSGGMFVGDNFFQHNTFDIAKLAAGSALKAAKLSSKGFAFSLARPPGHHAGKSTFAGFCYLNNIAFAVRKMQKEKGLGKVLIVDFDLHNGNGTQEIFYDDPKVFYFSMHQSPSFTYPFVGFASENNQHVLNIPLERGTTDEQYKKRFEENFLQIIKKFRPEMVAVSAGFDISSADRCVGNALLVKKSDTFAFIGKTIAKNFSGPIFSVLEGGYSLKELKENAGAFLQAFE